MLSLTTNNDLKIIDRNIPEIVQYSTTEVEIITPFYSTDDVVSFNLIRPDGSQAPEVYFLYKGELTPGQFLWESEISPYHTLNIPGKDEKGRIVFNLTLKHFSQGVIEYVKSSPVIRINVSRSIEPEPNVVEPSLADELFSIIGSGSLFDHQNLSFTSRSKSNAHPISAITSLEEEIGIFVGESEPSAGEKTWFKEYGDVEPLNEWQTLVSTPTIQSGAVFTYPTMPLLYPMRLRVEGTILGETVVQHLYNDSSLDFISGEIVLFIDESPENSIAINLGFYVEDNNIEVVTYENTAGTGIENFVAIAIEVYN
jgi:hypothetical protein